MSQATCIPSTKSALMVKGHHTDIVITHFDDHLLLVVTQLQKLGSIIRIQKESVPAEQASTISSNSATKVLLGPDEPLTHVIARSLASSIETHKPVLLTLALKEDSPDSVRQIASHLTALTKRS